MPTAVEYRVIGGQTYDDVQRKLNESAVEGFKPIFESSCANQNGMFITVILEYRSDESSAPQASTR
jgi:hypothetical protein